MDLKAAVGLAVLTLALGCTDPEPGETGETEDVGENRETGGGEGIAPSASRVEVAATVVDGRVVIDKDHHMTAVVGPGERVEWACVCDPELEFTIADLRPILDLEALTEEDMAALDQAMRGGPEAGPEARMEVLKGLAPAPAAAPPAPSKALDEGGPSAGRFGWTSGVGRDSFTDRPILSLPVPADAGLVVWKYTWRVRRKGDPASEAVWDPHIVTHPGTAIH